MSSQAAVNQNISPAQPLTILQHSHPRHSMPVGATFGSFEDVMLEGHGQKPEIETKLENSIPAKPWRPGRFFTLFFFFIYFKYSSMIVYVFS